MAMKINFFNKKIIFFVFRYKFRKLALNNLLTQKKMNDHIFVNLSGPYLCWFGILIYNLNLFKNFKFISCDGWPFLANESNSINIWFGGTFLKIPERFQKYDNNYVTAKTLFTNTDKIIQFYPSQIKEMKSNKNPKIIIALSCKTVKDSFALDVWNKNKNQILQNLALIEDENFWSNVGIDNFDIKYKHSIYIDIKSLVRIDLLKKIKNNFNDSCIFIGNDLKKYFPDALNSKFEYSYLKNLYNGNICLDFLAKDGDQILYPRSIEIIENGGTLFQVENVNSKKLFEKYKYDLTFNSSNEMIEKLERLIKHKELYIFNDYFRKKFNSINYNQKTFNKIF